MEKKLKPGFLKPIGGTGNLKKGLYKIEETPELYYPSEVIDTPDGQYITPDTPVGRYVTDENGNEIPLQNPFVRAVPAEILSLEEQYRAQANTAEGKILSMQREINTFHEQSSILQSISSIPNLSPINTHIIQKTNGILYYNKETGITENLSNFDIRVIKIIEYYQHDNLIDRKVCFCVVMENREIELMIRYNQIDSIVKVIQAEVIDAIIYANITKAEKKLEEIFREKLKNVFIEKCQCFAGWMTWRGEKIFAYDSHCQVDQTLKIQTGKKMIFTENFNCPYATFIEILELAPIHVIAPMISVCLLGPLHHIFNIANVSYTPRFLLFINGKTGSLKTAVSKLLFTYFNADNPLIPASFKDTKTAIEKRLEEYNSVPMLIDDFYSTNLKKEYTAMQEILEMIVRYIGDGIGKNRSNSQLEDVKGIPPSGMVVVTGEDTAGQMSTLLRCLIINVDKETFDEKILSEFQTNPFKWSSFLVMFISYLEKNYSNIADMIKERFEILRTNYKFEFSDRRPVDQIIQLQITFEILYDFLLKLNPQNEIDIENIIDKCINGCVVAVHNSLEYVKENSGENQYIFIMGRLINEKKILIATEKKDYEQNMQKYDGFMDNTYFYLCSDSVYIKIKKYFQNQGREISISVSNIKHVLDKSGILVTEIENRGTSKEKKLLEVKVKIGDKRPRMLKICQELFWSFVESPI